MSHEKVPSFERFVPGARSAWRSGTAEEYITGGFTRQDNKYVPKVSRGCRMSASLGTLPG